MIDEYVLQPGEARVLRVPRGARLGIHDIEGSQAAELVAFVQDDLAEHLDCAVTMEVIGRLFPTEKSKFYTNRYEPLFTLLEDTVGRHDLVHPASSKMSRSLFLGESGEREGTLERFRDAFATEGVDVAVLPRPVHLFRWTDVDGDGNFVLMETPSEAGQGVKLQVERDALVGIAVPDDEISPVTGCNPTPIRVTVEGVV